MLIAVSRIAGISVPSVTVVEGLLMARACAGAPPTPPMLLANPAAPVPPAAPAGLAGAGAGAGAATFTPRAEPPSKASIVLL